MLLCRFGSEGLLAAGDSLQQLRVLFSDPYETPLSQWQFGRAVDLGTGEALRAPLVPGKIVCVGRNYRDHAAELFIEPARRFRKDLLFVITGDH